MKCDPDAGPVHAILRLEPNPYRIEANAMETYEGSSRTNPASGNEGYDVRDTDRGNPDRGNVRASPGQNASVFDLIKDLRDETTTLFRQELALAKTEMSEKASRFSNNAQSVAIGGAVTLVGAIALISALAYALAALLNGVGLLSWPNALWTSWGLIGAVCAGVGYVLLKSGIDNIKRQSIVPEKTVESLKEDKQWLTSKTQS